MARRRVLLGPLGWRLFAAFLLVGIGAVALLAALAVASVRGQTSGLLASQQEQARRDVAAALAAAYTRAGSWTGIDLSGAQALAQSTGARLVILNEAGGRVATVTPGSIHDHGQGHQPGHVPGHDTSSHDVGRHPDGGSLAPPGTTAGGAVLAAAASPAATASPAAAADQVPVVVGGTTVGTVVISFPPASQSAAWQARGAILRAVGRGEPDAEKLLRPGPGELGQVSAAFATMAATVADTGPGIPEADLPHVFERFWRGTGSHGRSGAGIGLAVAAELATAHGGSVTAASPPGSGAVFTVTLPVA